jgi:Fic family protein
VATSDPSASAPLDILQADRLYEPFPDFASWKGLTETDLDLWDRFAKGLEAQRAAAPPEAFGRAVEVAMRAAAIDTGAIEGLYDVDRGFTMSVATQAFAWEHAVDEKGADVRALFEAQLEAYELVLDAATKSRPVYEAWIRQLHEVLCRAQATYRVLTPSGWQEHELVKGQYKTLPNHVRLKDGTFHAYSPVDRVPHEMHRLVEILTSPEFDAAHPVLQASYAHYSLVNVHPFADGNGRVARALASLYFYRAVAVPLVIFANQKVRYIDALAAADGEHLEPLVTFFRDRGVDAMQRTAETLYSAGDQPERIAEDIAFANAALRMLDAVNDELGFQISELRSPNLFLQTYPLISLRPKNEWALQAVLEETLSSVNAQANFAVRVNENETDPFRFAITGKNSLTNQLPALEVRIEDVHPELTESFRLRLSNWVRSNLAQLLQQLRKNM